MKMETKNNPKDNKPDIASMISSLTNPDESTRMDVGESAEIKTIPDVAVQEKEKETTASEGACRLWQEFLECLEDSKEDADNSSTKLYAIDNDIVETLHQCDFQAPNVYVINSILRAFLIDNIKHLKELPRMKVLSLLDKFG